jgi:hypothetical protein
MTEHIMKEEFIKVYNNCADDIFVHCYEKTHQRDVAKYMTRNIFMRTWDLISGTMRGAITIENALYRTMKDHINAVTKRTMPPRDASQQLWNLTLSQ